MADEPIEEEVVEVEEVVREDFPVLYAQETLVGSSVYDINLVFVQNSFKGSQVVANVALPPTTAKQLAATLAEHVAAYEASHGVIPAVPEVEEGEA